MYATKTETIKLYYNRLGTGEPLVLIHGLGEVKEGWFKQYELADEYDLIIPDLRGHGENNLTEGISIKNFAKDVLDLMDELGIESAHILGLSMGGTVAQEIYRQAPARCRSLILVSTFHFAPRIIGLWFLHFKMLRSKVFTPQQLSEMTVRACLFSWEEETLKQFRKYYRPNPEGYDKSMRECFKVDNRELLPKIKVPTLIIGGQFDTITPVWIQLLMHQSIPNSKLVIFKNSGHVTKMEVAEKFNQTIRSFINKQKTVKI
ncbi:alpha/beta fold hydrolase [Bacillus sp. AFS041924]|uniref:alpha/beta fold hydrolase n=1 Tax=Bacillus sp. AFS041924 TaxID=2033503 RepID=UPI000BFBCA52|nr:alpha/beta hydrolase [Bacillus sp. AFS041924]PGS47931.1 alpha/beta hydrolase [Bacillus sp. AFS041924]